MNQPTEAADEKPEKGGLKFTKAEIHHLQSLIEVNEREGWYYGNKDQYWKRSNRIKEKLSNLTTSEPSKSCGHNL